MDIDRCRKRCLQKVRRVALGGGNLGDRTDVTSSSLCRKNNSQMRTLKRTAPRAGIRAFLCAVCLWNTKACLAAAKGHMGLGGHVSQHRNCTGPRPLLSNDPTRSATLLLAHASHWGFFGCIHGCISCHPTGHLKESGAWPLSAYTPATCPPSSPPRQAPFGAKAALRQGLHLANLSGCQLLLPNTRNSAFRAGAAWSSLE